MIHSKHSRYALVVSAPVSSFDTPVRNNLLLRGLGRQATNNGPGQWMAPLNMKLPVMRVSWACLTNTARGSLAKYRIAG